MEMMPEITTENVKARIADTLRMYVGHGKRLSFADLAEATGDEERKLRSYVEAGGSLMPIDVMLRVFSVLPPEAFARIARVIGFSAAPLETADIVNVRKVLSQSARLVANGNEYLEDGVLKHTEKAQFATDAAALIPQLQSIAEGGTTH
ncbi:MAG: hypothetical protein ABJP02_05025 [Parasphingorhabdus sp.]|uniref:hypothetical protein n=1 Tax=Parasphingorhabdus sp. TaxID=2709688 RepID=UPI0032989625